MSGFAGRKNKTIENKATDGHDIGEDLGFRIFKEAIRAQCIENIAGILKDGINEIAKRLGVYDEIHDLAVADVCPRLCEEIDSVLDANLEASKVSFAVISRLWPDGVPDEGVDDYDVKCELDRRLMPPGMEWPRLESGEKVHFMNMCVSDSGDNFHAKFIGFGANLDILIGDKTSPLIVENWACIRQGERVKRPVLGADGMPIHEGDRGYWIEQPGIEILVKRIDQSKCAQLTVFDVHGRGNTISADEFTHTKPEPPDSWERWRRDMMMPLDRYVEDVMGEDITAFDYIDLECMAASHKERRAKALAEREMGE